VRQSGMSACRLGNTAQAAHGSVVGTPFDSVSRPRVEPGARSSLAALWLQGNERGEG
jgi:hypothetical protein